MERLTLLQALKCFRMIKYSHLLIVLASHIESIDNGALKAQTIWNREQFKEACHELILEAIKFLS